MTYKLIALLHRSSLRIFVLKDGKSEDLKIDYPETVVKDSDIFDLEKFGYDLKNQLIKRPELKGSEILFLIPPEKYESRIISLKGTNLVEERSRFVASLSGSEEETLLKININGNKALFSAFPKKLLVDIDTVLSKIGFKARFVSLPQVIASGFSGKETGFILFDLDDHLHLIYLDLGHFTEIVTLFHQKKEEIASEFEKLRADKYPEANLVYPFLDNLDLKAELEKVGFKVVSPKENDIFKFILPALEKNQRQVINASLDPTNKKEVMRTRQSLKILLAVLLAVFFLSLVGATFFLFKNLSTLQTPKPAVREETAPEASTGSTPTPVREATPAAVLVTKESLIIKIWNGNGVPGDAGQLKKTLEKAGFANIETDTADPQDQVVTIVKVSSRMSNKDRNELEAVLEKVYSKVQFNHDVPQGNLDVAITTGPRL